MGFNSSFDSRGSSACGAGGGLEVEDGMRKAKGGGKRKGRERGASGASVGRLKMNGKQVKGQGGRREAGGGRLRAAVRKDKWRWRRGGRLRWRMEDCGAVWSVLC